MRTRLAREPVLAGGKFNLFGAAGELDNNRKRADARGVPADIMMPRLLMMLSVFLLVMVGLVMVFSASMVEAIALGDSVFSFVSKQLLFAATGTLFAVIIYARIPYHAWLGRLFYPAWGLCIVLILLVPVIGTEILGAKRWIFIGPMSIQPTEFLKIALVVGMARVMYEINGGGQVDWKAAGIKLVVIVVAPLLFMYKTQSDMGSALIIAVGALTVLWLAEAPMKLVLGIVAAGLLIVAAGLTVGYRAERLSTWLDPMSYAEDGGLQSTRSFYAFGEGGVFGSGLGNSREKFQLLPEVETDFVYAVIGEELGLIGAAAVIVLFMVVLLAGLRISAVAPDNFGTCLAGGLTVMLVGQAFLNIAVVTGIFPTTGKPLPFVSSGGSSMWSSLIIVGLILSVSRGSNVLTSHEKRRNDLNVLRVERDSASAGRPRSQRKASPAFESIRVERPEGARQRVSARMDRAEQRSNSEQRPRSRRSELNLGTGRDRSYYGGSSEGRPSGRPGRGRR